MTFNKKLEIKISTASANLKFIECGPQCISRGCTAKCCDAPTHPDGMKVTILPHEEQTIRQMGAKIEEGYLKPGNKKGCPFKDKNHLCSLHGTPHKPFGCIASPFMLNKNNTLIIRNRYKLLPCYDKVNGKPAYEVFRSSLEIIFEETTNELIKVFSYNPKDFYWPISQTKLNYLKGRESILKN